MTLSVPLLASRLPVLRLPLPAASTMLPAVMLPLLASEPEAFRLTAVRPLSPPDRVPKVMLPPLPVVTTLMALPSAVRLPVLTAPLAALRLRLPAALRGEAMLRLPPVAVMPSAPLSLMPWPAVRLTDWPLTLLPRARVPLP